jgi:hypothetical protein
VSKFWLRHVKGQTRSIHDGRVRCDLHGGEIDATECAECPALIQLTLAGPSPNVRCRSVSDAWAPIGR